MNNKIDFKIVPVFYQNSVVWSNFSRILTVCDKDMGYNYNAYTEKICLRAYMLDWDCNKYNFAFAAYHKTQMIGFIKGFADKEEETYVDSLYVLPKYHGMNIGTQLLQAAEKTSALVAKRISLTSLSSAIDFYKNNGYDFSVWGDPCRGFMVKSLSPCMNTIVPVFKCTKHDFKVNFHVKVNSALFKQNEYQPIFVYVNEYGKINGVAFRNKKGENKILVKDVQDEYRYELFNMLNKMR